MSINNDELANDSNELEYEENMPKNSLEAEYKELAIQGLWKNNPEWSLWAGYGQYDHVLTIPNAESRAKDLSNTQTELALLATFDLDQLNQNQKTDYYLIKNLLEKKRKGEITLNLK